MTQITKDNGNKISRYCPNTWILRNKDGWHNHTKISMKSSFSWNYQEFRFLERKKLIPIMWFVKGYPVTPMIGLKNNFSRKKASQN